MFIVFLSAFDQWPLVFIDFAHFSSRFEVLPFTFIVWFSGGRGAQRFSCTQRPGSYCISLLTSMMSVRSLDKRLTLYLLKHPVALKTSWQLLDFGKAACLPAWFCCWLLNAVDLTPTLECRSTSALSLLWYDSPSEDTFALKELIGWGSKPHPRGASSQTHSRTYNLRNSSQP